MINPETHAFASRQDGANLENEAPNTFLILKKRNYENKRITSFKRDNGSSTSDPEEVLQEQKNCYQNLYSSQNPQVDDSRFNKFFQNETIKTLDNDQKERCEGLVTETECRYALKGFQNNKSPGTDGLTAEFCSFFWDHLSSTRTNSFNYGFVKGQLSISQRQAIIRLIPKKNKNYRCSRTGDPSHS